MASGERSRASSPRGARPCFSTAATRLKGTLRCARSARRPATSASRFYLADFSSLAQVRGLAEQILAEHERLDVLVNNAGIGTGGRTATEREVSQDGYELRFAVMYLAPLPADAAPRAAARPLRSGADRQRRLRGPGGDRLRRRDARARLQRRPGVLPEQDRPRDADVRPRRRAARPGSDGQLPPPGHVHADEDGPRRGRQPGRLARVGSRGDHAAGRRSRP